jgi:hypothetical protein
MSPRRAAHSETLARLKSTRGTVIKRAIILLVAGTFLAMSSTWSAVAQHSAQDSIDDPEVYAVYASLLPDEWTVRTAHAKTLVFQEETGTNWGCMPSGKPLEEDWRPVVDSFRSENARVKGLRPGFPSSHNASWFLRPTFRQASATCRMIACSAGAASISDTRTRAGTWSSRPLVSTCRRNARWSTWRIRAAHCVAAEPTISWRRSRVPGGRPRFRASRIACGRPDIQ